MKKKCDFIAEIDSAELAARIVEACFDLRRPPGLTAKQALEKLDVNDRQGALRAAKAAAEYLTECINAGGRPS
jgi:hypothetical protein